VFFLEKKGKFFSGSRLGARLLWLKTIVSLFKNLDFVDFFLVFNPVLREYF